MSTYSYYAKPVEFSIAKELILKHLSNNISELKDDYTFGNICFGYYDNDRVFIPYSKEELLEYIEHNEFVLSKISDSDKYSEFFDEIDYSDDDFNEFGYYIKKYNSIYVDFKDAPFRYQNSGVMFKSFKSFKKHFEKEICNINKNNKLFYSNELFSSTYKPIELLAIVKKDFEDNPTMIIANG